MPAPGPTDLFKSALFCAAHAGARRRSPSAPYRMRFRLALRRAWEEAQLRLWETEQGIRKPAPAPVTDPHVAAVVAKHLARLEAQIAAEKGVSADPVRLSVGSNVPKSFASPALSAKVRSVDTQAPMRPG